MDSDIKQDAHEEIRQLLRSISDAWSKGHPEELEEYFHENMLIVQPGSQGGGRGKRECVDSYKDFVSHATIREFKESDQTIDVWGDTAVASYKFEMAYEMRGEVHKDSGYDLFVFSREKGKWLVVWRTILPVPVGE